MHALIPLTSQSILSLCAWTANTLTPAALVAGFLLAASQSQHLWSAFFGFFVVFFLAATGLQVAMRRSRTASNGSSGPPPRATCTAAFLVANLAIAAALVPLHQVYLKLRLASVPWFNIFRAPKGCLPIPSRSLTTPDPDRWVFTDALGNQLPFAVVVSYAAAMANTFSENMGGRSANSRLSSTGVLAGAVGALMMALTAASLLPVCEESHEGTGALETMMHVDRSTAWDERTSMTWSQEARYGKLVIAVTAVGTVGLLLQPGLRKIGVKSSYLANFLSNVAVTGSIVLGMACWSFY